MSADLTAPTTRTLLQIFAIPRTRWLMLLAGVTVIALLVRLLTFEQFLPYLETRLEGNAFLLALDWRGLDTSTIYGVSVAQTGDWLAGYPPLYIWLVMAVQQVFDSVAKRPWMLISDYVYVLRLIAAICGTLTTLLIAAATREISNPLGAVFSGLLWALSPVILQHNTLATSDPLAYLLVAASLYAALRAWNTIHPAWTLSSLIFGLLAIYAKYPTFPVLLPWGLSLLYLLWVRGRSMLPWLLFQGMLSLAAALYLLYGHGAATLSNGETATFREQGIGLMLDMGRHINNAGYALLPIGATFFLVTVLLAAIASIYGRQREAILKWPGVGLLLAYSLGGILVVSGFFYLNDSSEMRHVLPISVALIIVWGGCAAQIIYSIRQRLQGQFPALSRLLPSAAATVLLLTLLMLAVPVIRYYQLPHTIPWLWRWADINLPNEGSIMMSADHAQTRQSWSNLWNRPYSGYDGQQYFNWVFIDEVGTETAQDLADKGVTYLLMTSDDTSYQKPDMQRFIAGLMPIKSIPDTGGETAGPGLSLYRLLPPHNTTAVSFGGEIILVGYDLSAVQPAPGDQITLRPYWQIEQPPTANYSLFIQLYPADEDRVLAQYDGAPTVPERLTLTWNDRQETYIGQQIQLQLPDDLVPGDYRLALGLYDFETGQRLPTDAGQTYTVIPLTVRPSPQ